MSSSTPSINQVTVSLSKAASSGIISPQSMSVIEAELDDIALGGCSGIDEVDSEEVTLVAVLVDASDSMHMYQGEVIRSYNELFLEPLKKAKTADSILVSAWSFSADGDKQNNVRLIHGYTPVPQCPKLSAANYQIGGMTPLNDAVMNAVTGLISYGQTLRDNGTRTKSIVVVLSDGQENASSVTKKSVKTLTADVLKSEEFVLSLVFFGDEQEGNRAAEDIGFPVHHRLTSQLDGAGIRRVFGAVSASVIATSQSKVSSASLSANPFFAGR